MDGDYEITHGMVRGVAMSHGFIPLLPMASRGRDSIEDAIVNAKSSWPSTATTNQKPAAAFNARSSASFRRDCARCAKSETKNAACR